MKKASTALVAFLLVAAAAARAQSVNITDYSNNTTACLAGTACGAVGTTAAVIAPAGEKATLEICNSGATTIGIGMSQSISIGSAGTIELVPVGTSGAGPVCHVWGPGTAPTEAVYGISSGSGGKVTILVGTS